MTREAARDDARDDGATPRARATNFAVISSPRSVIDRWAQRSRCTSRRWRSRAELRFGHSADRPDRDGHWHDYLSMRVRP